jgi:hypothetical protein
VSLRLFRANQDFYEHTNSEQMSAWQEKRIKDMAKFHHLFSNFPRKIKEIVILGFEMIPVFIPPLIYFISQVLC